MPRIYRELSPEETLKLLEGHEDILSGETRKLEAFYRQQFCPRCGHDRCDRHFISVAHAFPSNGEYLVPRSGMKCQRCDCVFDPHSGLVVQQGINPGFESGSEHQG